MSTGARLKVQGQGQKYMSNGMSTEAWLEVQSKRMSTGVGLKVQEHGYEYRSKVKSTRAWLEVQE